jgi:hypothetical protein
LDLKIAESFSPTIGTIDHGYFAATGSRHVSTIFVEADTP